MQNARLLLKSVATPDKECIPNAKIDLVPSDQISPNITVRAYTQTSCLDVKAL